MRRGIKGHEIAKNIISVSGIVIFAKLLGFVKQMVMAGSFGATIETDLISLSQNLIGDMDYLLVQVLITAFIPIYIEVKKESGKKASVFVSNTLVSCLIASALIIAVLFISAPFIAGIIAPAYTEELHASLIRYIRLYVPTILPMLVCAVFNALLRANKHFVPGELVSVIQSATVIILTLFLSKRAGVKVLVISYFAYTVMNTVFLTLSARREWTFLREGRLYDSYSVRLFKMAFPLFFGYAMIFINQQVDKVIVSGLGEGVVTAVGYAAVLSNLVATLTGTICSVIFSYVSQHVADGREEEAGNMIRKSAVVFTTLLVPVCILILFNAGDIVKIVYGRGAFSDTAVKSTAMALVGYGVSVVFYAYRELFGRLQYSYHDSRQPMINSSIGIVFNVAFSIILSRFLGVLGVTLASSFSVMICAVLNILSARRHNKYIRMGTALRYLPYWIAGGAVCAFISVQGAAFLADANTFLRFMVVLAVSFMVYGIMCGPVFLLEKGENSNCRKGKRNAKQI